MTIIKKWRKMLASFSDIKTAIAEKSGKVTGDCLQKEVWIYLC